MNRKLYMLLLISACLSIAGFPAFAQTPGFVQQENIKIPGITTDAQIYPLPTTQKQTTRAYYDGLGRTIQTIGVQTSPLQNDMMQPIAYDNLGRQTSSYLPYAGQSTDVTGSYRANAISTAQPAFYNNTSQYVVANDAAPYTQQVFENSPLQRLLTAGMVGSGFQPGGAALSGGSGTQHYKTVAYRPNNSSDGNILVWNPDGTYTSGAYYTAGTLSVTDGVDEDGTETLSFTDYAGHAILKRQKLAGANLDTYYIYNNAGMPAFIIPPKALALMVSNGSYSISQTGVNALVFTFAYNVHGQLIQKTVPAKGTVSIVYDPLNRPVLMQDANMAVSNQWNYIKYDAKGRAISQGIYTDNNYTNYAAMQSHVSGLGASYATAWYENRSGTVTNNGYYTNSIFPSVNITPLAYSYYDNYDLNQDGNPDFSYASQGLTNEETATPAQLKGMPTMISKTTVGTGLSGVWLTTVIFYDKRGNAIQSQSNNQLYYQAATTLTDSKTTVPDFTGVPQISQVVKQTASGTSTKVLTTFTYDQVNRLSTVSQQYNGGAVTKVAAYNYNELGQLIQKNLGQIASGLIPANITLNSTFTGSSPVIATNSITLVANSDGTTGFNVPSGTTFSAFISTGYLQTLDYRYNIRGQLLSINNSKLNNDNGVRAQL